MCECCTWRKQSLLSPEQTAPKPTQELICFSSPQEQMGITRREEQGVGVTCVSQIQVPGSISLVRADRIFLLLCISREGNQNGAWALPHPSQPLALLHKYTLIKMAQKLTPAKTRKACLIVSSGPGLNKQLCHRRTKNENVELLSAAQF